MTDPDLVRRLVTLLADNISSRAINHELLTAGYQEAEILDGWVEARLASFTESTGLGRDRLTNSAARRLRGVQQIPTSRGVFEGQCGDASGVHLIHAKALGASQIGEGRGCRRRPSPE